MMKFQKVDERISIDNFKEIINIEQNCGLEPYSMEMLWYSIINLDTFACYDEQKIVAFITTTINSRYFNDNLYIVNINVKQEYQRRGIATKLIYEVCQYYDKILTNSLVTLDVMKDNLAMELYLKLGFEKTDIISKNGTDNIVMMVSFDKLRDNLNKIIKK